MRIRCIPENRMTAAVSVSGSARIAYAMPAGPDRNKSRSVCPTANTCPRRRLTDRIVERTGTRTAVVSAAIARSQKTIGRKKSRIAANEARKILPLPADRLFSKKQ